jgi:hypothetical protein
MRKFQRQPIGWWFSWFFVIIGFWVCAGLVVSLVATVIDWWPAFVFVLSVFAIISILFGLLSSLITIHDLWRERVDSDRIEERWGTSSHNVDAEEQLHRAGFGISTAQNDFVNLSNVEWPVPHE